MRRHQQRHRPRRGSGQCLGAEAARWRTISPSDHAAPFGPPKCSSCCRRKPPAAAAVASSCSLSGAESQQELMARRRSPGRFTPPRGYFVDAYSSEPEAVGGGEGGLAHRSRYEAGPFLLPPRRAQQGRAKGSASPPPQHRGKSSAASVHPRRPSCKAHHSQRLAPGGSGTPYTNSCTTLYRGDSPGPHRERHSRSPVAAGRLSRMEELLRDEQWASPVYGADFLSDASKPPSACPSSFSFCQLDSKGSPKLDKKAPRRKGWQEASCDTSPSLADLMQSWTRQYEEEEPPSYAPQQQDHRHGHYPRPASSHQKPRRGDAQHIHLQDLADKRYEDLIPARDKKIAALMLARHQEEEEMKQRQLQVLDAWEKMKRKEKKNKAKQEKEKQYQLVESLDQWQRDRDQRKAKLRLEERQLLAAQDRDLMCDRKWKKFAKEQDCRRREKLENARLQAEYKKHQEKHLWDQRFNERNSKEQNSHLYKEKMLQALEKRLIKEMERKRKKVDMNEYKKAKHLHLKDQEDDRIKADELYKRLCIEQKLQRSQEILEQLLEERNQELKEKSCKEEEQESTANVRAKETEEEKRRRKEMLLQIAEMKIQQAREIMSKNMQDRAQKTKEINCMKERNHHCRKQKLDYEDKCHLLEMQEALRRKEQKTNQILKRKDAAIEESRRIAKASFDLREKVRDLINHNSFDQMALDVQQKASVLRGL